MGLEGMSVVLTRPLGQADQLAEAIEAQGGHCIHYPLMEINALDPEHDRLVYQQAQQAILNLDQYQQLIFISTNAVRYGMDWIEQYWPQLPVDIRWLAIGRATGQALQTAGVPCEISSDEAPMNSEALLQLPGLQNLQGQKLLILRGVGGREYLAEQLRQRGALVDYAECYRRGPVSLPAGELDRLLEEQHNVVLLANSGETLAYLGEALTLPSSRQLPLVVPGERVVGMAQEQGFSNIVCAGNAGTAAIIQALQQVADQ